MLNGSIYTYLTVFHAIAEQKSIAGAARKLETTSPSVSKSLKLLENYFGVSLVNRTTRRLEITEAGLYLLHNTQKPMSELEHTLERVKNFGQDISGIIRITTARYAYLTILKPYIGEFHQAYPDIQLEISVDNGMVDILKDSFDLGIRFEDRIDEHVIARQLLPSLTQGVFASKHYIHHYGEPKSPHDLKNHKLIGFRFATANRISPFFLQENGHKITVDMPVSLIVNDIDVAMDAIRQGTGIGRLFLINLAQEVDADQFIPILKPYWMKYPPVYLYYLKASKNSKRIQIFIEFIMGKMKQYAMQNL